MKSIAQRLKGIKPSLLTASALASIILLPGCGPSITCNQNVDGDQLLKSLTEPALSVEVVAQSTVQLLSACAPKQEQQSLIDKAIGKIATEGSAQIQADFYSKISQLVPTSKARLDFIAQSSLVAGTAKSTQDQLHLVEFDQLGKPLDLAIASPQISAAIRELGLAGETDVGLVRQVDTDSGPLVMMRSIMAATSGFTESSEIRIFDPANGKKLIVPMENATNYVLSLPADAHILEYFFACSTLTGMGCGTQDTRYAVDQTGKLKYLASVHYSNQDGGHECTVDLGVSRPQGQSIKRVAALTKHGTIACPAPPTPDDHGEPFQVFPEADLLKKLLEMGGYPNMAELVSFKRKDAADNALKTRLWSQGERWRGSLLEGAMENLDTSGVYSAKTVQDALKVLSQSIGVAANNLDNLKWLASGSGIDSTSEKNLASMGERVETIRARLKEMIGPGMPKDIDEPEYVFVRVGMSIAREVTYDEKATIVLEAQDQRDGYIFPKEADPATPYVYFGSRLGEELTILMSQERLVDRPAIIEVLAKRARKPMKLMNNGFTKDFWVYRTLSDAERVEHQAYVKKLKEYNQQLVDYKKAQQQSTYALSLVKKDIDYLGMDMAALANELR